MVDTAAPNPDPFTDVRASFQNAPTPPKVSPLLILETSRWCGVPAPVVLWILAGLLARREAGCLAGRSNVGKGFLMLLFMLSVATGRDLFGRKGTGKPMRVILVEMEDSPEELHRRINRMIDLMRLDPSWIEADELAFWANLTIITPNWNSEEPKTLSGLLPDLKAVISDLTKDGSEIGLLVLDTFSALSGGDENSAEAQRDFAAAVYQLRDLTGACVLAVHHLRKPGNAGKAPSLADRLSFDSVRGSSAIVAFLRFVLQVEALTPAEALRIGLSEEKAQRGGYAVLATTKVVSGPKGDWILLEQAEGVGGGFWTVHPRSDELCAQLHSKTAVANLSQDEAVLLSIADGITDRQALRAKHWPNLLEKGAEMALKGVLQRLRGERHGWVEPGRSMVLTDVGRRKVQQLREARNNYQNERNRADAEPEDVLDL
jgi:hypothetical protein